MADGLAPAPRERGWARLAFALAAFLLVPLFPAARAVFPDDADEVYQRGRALGGLDEALGLEDVAGDAIDGLEAAQGGLGAGAHQAPHEEATADQGPHHRTTDESGAPGDEDPLHSGAS